MSYVNSVIFIDFLRVDLNQEDSEGGPTADAPTKDDQKTDEIAIVETEEILVIVPEAIEYVTIAPEKKAGVTEAGDAIEDQQLGLVYATRVEMAKSTIMADGREVRLGPGMAATVEIKTGKRRIIEFVMSPLLRYKNESLRKR